MGFMFRGNVPLAALVCQRRHRAAEQLRLAKKEMESEGKSVLGALMFTCCARDEHADAGAFTSTFPATPLAGMPCGGEIGPDNRQSAKEGFVTQVGNTQMQGYTAIYGLFSHPVRARTTPLYVAEVEEAYRASRTRPAAVAAAAATEQVKGLPDGDVEFDEDDA